MSQTLPAMAILAAADQQLGSHLPKPTSLTSGQTEASVTAWQSLNGGTRTGIWEATPGLFPSVRDGIREVCFVLSGRATITNNDGDTIEVGAGDLFVMPPGWAGTWEIHETLRKVFVIVTELT